MKSQRRKISAEQKVIILRELLENSRSISELSTEYNINPNLIYRWKKQLFEQAVEIFAQKSNKKETLQDREIEKLKTALSKRETAISVLLQDNIELKKSSLGNIDKKMDRARYTQ